MHALPTRRLPRTGHALTALGLGGAPLGNFCKVIAEADVRATFASAWAAGIRYFDTAPYYGAGLSEQRFGTALREHPRSEWVLSSKVGRLLKPWGPRATPVPVADWLQPLPFEVVFDYTAAGIERSVEDSLQRLGLNTLDIALVHDIGSYTHGALHTHYWTQLTIGGGFRTLESLRRSGVVGAIGLGVNEWQIVQDAMEHVDLDTSLLAGRYTLLEQASLHPFLASCQQRGVGVVVGGPFNSGILAAGTDSPSAAARFNYAAAPQDVVQRAAQLQAVCASFGVPLGAAALQFPLGHPAVVSVVPGPRSVQELQGILDWATHPIPPALWTALREQGLLHADAPLPGAAA